MFTRFIACLGVLAIFHCAPLVAAPVEAQPIEAEELQELQVRAELSKDAVEDIEGGVLGGGFLMLIVVGGIIFLVYEATRN